MRKLIITAIAAGAALMAVAPAAARDGCGLGAHRGPGGYCHPNYGPAVFAPGVRVGFFYPNRGYWDGHRYWGHRYGWQGGWRYR